MPRPFAAQAARAGFAARLAAYRFAKYRTKEKPEAQPSIAKVEVVTADAEAARAAYAPLSAVADGVLLARDLVSEPPNVLYPASFAERCRELTRLGLEVEVLGEAEMEALGMRTLLAVGRGSAKESQLVVMRWNGAGGKGGAPLAFVGKGVTFDTGGISHQAGRGHGGHEVRHGRGRGRDRRARRARRAQGQGRRGGRPGPGREHAGRRRRSGPATSSCRCRARRWR